MAGARSRHDGGDSPDHIRDHPVGCLAREIRFTRDPVHAAELVGENDSVNTDV